MAIFIKLADNEFFGCSTVVGATRLEFRYIKGLSVCTYVCFITLHSTNSQEQLKNPFYHPKNANLTLKLIHKLTGMCYHEIAKSAMLYEIISSYIILQTEALYAWHRCSLLHFGLSYPHIFPAHQGIACSSEPLFCN